MRVGFVGVGNMGGSMLAKVVSAGHDVSFFARRADVVKEVESLGATSVPSVADLASSAEVVVVCVFTDEQVREVCLGSAGLIAAMPAGSTLVVHSTCRPDTAPTLAEQGRVSGVHVVDAPFSGGPADAERASLTLLVGGDELVLEAVREVLSAYAEPIIHVGGLGDGQRVKLVNNALFGANVRLVVEAERLAGDLGLNAAKAIEAISYCSARSHALTLAMQNGSAAALNEAAGKYISKDIEVARRFAIESGTDVGLLSVVASARITGEGGLPPVPESPGIQKPL